MKKTMRFLLAAVAVVLGMTSCEEIMSSIDNPVDSYLKVDAEVFVKEGSAVELYAETISDAEITYTVGDEKIAKVEKVSNHEVKVIGVKPGETVINVKLAANDYYKAGEAKVKVVVAPTYTLKDAVVDGAKLKIGYKFNGKDCLFAYEYDADNKVFNLLPDNSTLPEGYYLYLAYNGDDKITQYLWDMNINKVLTLNLYTGGSFDRIYKEPCEMTSLQVNNYEMLPYVPESVTPIADLQAGLLPDNMTIGDKGSFAVTGVIPQNATNQVIKYSSSNTAVMTIDANGNIEAVGAGEATLKAEATDGSGKYVEHTVTVSDTPTYLKWDNTKKELVATPFPATVTTMTSSTTIWEAGTYVVEGEVTITGGNLQGNVDLIIKDGAKLTVNGRITGSSSKYNLSIYGQANQTGQLVVNCTSTDAIYNITTLEVHSCQVKATSPADNSGGFYNISTFNVYGGSVDAEGTGSYCDGIWLANNGSMNIYGGEVKAVGKGNDNFTSYGIMASTTASVTVYGGKLWAECAGNKARRNITLTKGAGFTGKIEYSSDKSAWSETVDNNAKYVRVGY